MCKMKRVFGIVCWLFFALFAHAQEGWTTTCDEAAPQLLEVMVDACGDEGRSEYVILRTGCQAIRTSQIAMRVMSVGTNLVVTQMSNFSYSNNNNALDTLNMNVPNCPTGAVFRHVGADSMIPPRSTVMVFLNFNRTHAELVPMPELCGAEVFVIYGRPLPSYAAGSFRNHPFPQRCMGDSCLRRIEITFSNTAPCLTQLTYDISNLPAPPNSAPPDSWHDGSYIRPRRDNTVAYAGGWRENSVCMQSAMLRCKRSAIVRRDTTICRGDSLMIGKKWYRQTARLVDTIANFCGCDSILHTNLTVLRRDTTVLNRLTCRTRDTGTVVQRFVNAVACDSFVVTRTRLYEVSPIRLRIGTAQILGCEREAADGALRIDTLAGGTLPYQFRWSNGAATTQISGLRGAVYTLTVTDAQGCMQTDTFNLHRLRNLSISIALPISNCQPDSNDRRFQILRISGGDAPFSYQIDSASVQKVSQLPLTLTPPYRSLHRLTVRDSNGCRVDTIFQLPNPDGLRLTLAENILVNMGDSLRIEPEINFLPTRIRWQPRSFLSCDTCLSPVCATPNSIRYQLSLTDSIGCKIEKYTNIAVVRTGKYFLPNVFSPNGDGINDRLELSFDPSFAKILGVKIFNRWGNLCYQTADFLPNHPPIAWDGNGFPNDLYILLVEVQYLDGSITLLKSDVLLMR